MQLQIMFPPSSSIYLVHCKKKIEVCFLSILFLYLALEGRRKDGRALQPSPVSPQQLSEGAEINLA